MEALLALEDGRTFKGKSFGAEGEVSGEIVFNTSLTGYQEILTDPSYAGQIVVLTYPLIGNYGVNPQDAESLRPFAEGLVVREIAEVPSNWRQQTSLPDYLREQGILGISEVDTRALVRHIRTHGAMRCMISTRDLDADSLVRKTRSQREMMGQDLVKEVTCEESYSWKERTVDLFPTGKEVSRNATLKKEEPPFKVLAFDFGIKHNIMRLLVDHGCDLTVVPARTSASRILDLNPDGIFLSNGPGDPEPVTYAVDTVRQLLRKKPIFGICLGHQILGLALGGRTYKLKFGHRGGNHPVLRTPTGQVEITAQNHGFAVDIDSLPPAEVELTHLNLNDQTLEGFRHKTLPVFCVQYHPESSPGPHDSRYLFEEFKSLMRQHRKTSEEKVKTNAEV
jgi:carbamoyl-phosphate synthase small subunit